jgi:hypothetical protein
MYWQPKGKSVGYLMGKTLILKTPSEIPEHDLLHAHNIHFTTYSTQYGFFGSAIGQILQKLFHTAFTAKRKISDSKWTPLLSPLFSELREQRAHNIISRIKRASQCKLVMPIINHYLRTQWRRPRERPRWERGD